MASKGTLRIKIVGDHGPLQSSIKGALGSLGGFVGQLAKIGGAAAAAIGVASVKAFADFDSAMNESLAIMGDVSDTMRGDMSDAAREVGKTTKFSASQAADAYFFLASAGMDAEQSIGALPQVAAFAQAGMFDMATATDLATDAQSALGLTSDDVDENLANLTRTTDVFVKANTLANGSVEQFATAMTSKAGTALQTLNKDIEEGTAALAVFADQGIKGERAGTVLTNTLNGLSNRARISAGAFESLGVEVFDTDGAMRNIADIVADLEVGLAGMSVEQREAELAALGFNKRTREGILALLGNSEALRGYERDLRDAAGTTQTVADKQMESFSAKMGLVWSQIQDVGISIGKALVPALEIFAGWLDSNLPAITGWFDDVSSKFEGLFGTADDTMAGTAEAMFGAGEAVHGFDNAVRDALGLTEGRLHGYDVVVGDVTASTEDNFLSMGEMMGRLADLWAQVFEDDIKPWFNDTFIPWLTDEASPAVGRAGVEMGLALARGLEEGIKGALPGPILSLISTVGDPSGLADRLKTFGSGGRLGRVIVDRVEGAAEPESRQQTIPTNLRSFHGGGVFRTRRPGGEGLALLRDREEIVTPEDRQRGQVVQNFYGPVNDDITGRRAALALRMA